MKQKKKVPKDEIDNATDTVDRADAEIKSLNTTIAGQMVLNKDFYRMQNVSVMKLKYGQAEIVVMKCLLTYLLLKN